MATEKPKGYRKAEEQAKTFVGNKAQTRHLIEQAFRKAYQNRGQLEKIWDDLMSLCRLVRAWAKGEYKAVPRKTILVAVAAVIYFLNPFDLIPDFLPGVGYLDDATVIAFVLNSIRKDVWQFLQWETQMNETTSS